MEPSLTQGTGYGIVIGLSIFFAVLLLSTTWIQDKYTSNNSKNVEEFTSASRNVPFGLILCGIVSTWCWSLTLLQPAVQCYMQGVSGAYYYALGGLLQVSVFSIVASKVKQNANQVTTFPEMAYFRFGNVGHAAFLWCGFVCNAIVSACILLGGSGVIAAVTGMSEYASLFLMPLGVAAYVSTGGLRATFISDVMHTFITLIFVFIFVFKVFASSEQIGSPTKMAQLLYDLPAVEGNYKGKYLTFHSLQGGIFAIRSTITGFGLVVCDQAYWSRAVAADYRESSKSYFFGSLSWAIIPTIMGTTLGLGARALETYADFPILSAEDVSAGLVGPAVVTYLLGKAGSVLMVLTIFLSVTSSFSGELVATSTLLSYDIYKKFIKKDATPDQVATIARWNVLLWAIFSAGLACIFKAIGISMGWLFNFLGVATASGVIPIILTFTWRKTNKWGATLGSILGMGLGLSVWLITCRFYVGEINVVNLSNEWVSFAGTSASLFLGGIITVSLSLIRPSDFQWSESRDKTLVGVSGTLADDSVELSSMSSRGETSDEGLTKLTAKEEIITDDTDSLTSRLALLERQYKKYTICCCVSGTIFAVIIPLGLGVPRYVFSDKFFTAVISIMIAWLFATFGLVILMPVFEAREFLVKLAWKPFRREV